MGEFKLMIELVIMKIDLSEVNHLFAYRANDTKAFARDFHNPDGIFRRVNGA